MDPMLLIDRYVDDVVRGLPRRSRTDVAKELRGLLGDELAGLAADRGEPADEAMALELVRGFGRPLEVADRYRPAGFAIVRPSSARRFTAIALGGVALQWLITLPAALLSTEPIAGWDFGGDPWWGRLAVWWLGAGLGALWWPGILITFLSIGALVANRPGAVARPWSPRRTTDRNPVDRLGVGIQLALGTLGVTVWLIVWRLPEVLPGLPQPALDALALAPDFLVWRAPWVLALWALSLGLLLAVLIAGRWTPVTQRIRLVGDLLMLALLVWWIVGGRIMVQDNADSATRVLLGLLVVGYGAAVAYREVVSVRRARR